MDEFRLRMALVEVQRMTEQHGGLLDRPVRLMDAKAWVGPSARAFERELLRNRRVLQEQLRKAADSLQRAGGGAGVVR
ncbi:hypothetical protein [Actinocorallia libanotica]|uniref:Uncharacterized protein n=1 Tax=Actinocorallia libanotica TaxID=46162 RepID=A0ABN1R8I7_9ACTN